MSFGMKTFYNGTSFPRADIPMPDNDTFFQGVLALIFMFFFMLLIIWGIKKAFTHIFKIEFKAKK